MTTEPATEPTPKQDIQEPKATSQQPEKSSANEMKTDSSSSEPNAKPGPNNSVKDQHKTSGDYYFDSYSHYGIHEEMLKDQVRTRTYMSSIVNNKHLFKGKTVLEVGAGTGILCLFAAQAGAKKVYGIECASIAKKAEKIAEANGFGDVITIVNKKVEDIEDLPDGCKEVDIIISEWMGYFLLYESMLDSVIYARDKWLKKDTGILMPDKASMYFCGIEDGAYKQKKIGFWTNVYGFDMSVMAEDVLKEPLVDVCPCDGVITDVVKTQEINLYTVTREQLNWKSEFTLRIARNDYMHALVGFFNVEFTKCHIRTGFSTGPFNQYTHWKQTVFYMDNDLTVSKGDQLKCSIAVKRNLKNPRNLDIRLCAIHEPTVEEIQKTKNERLYLMR